jgi:methionyl aminopeptidase
MIELLLAAALGGATVYGYRWLRDRRLAQGWEPVPAGVLLPQMRVACAAVSDAMSAMRDAALPGSTTEELEQVAIGCLQGYEGVEPYFRDFLSFPSLITASLNDEVINTVPSKRALQKGDLLKVQFGALYGRAFAYQAWSYEVGSLRLRPILESLEATLTAAAAAARPGRTIRAISTELQKGIECVGWVPNAHYCGHRIGSVPRSSPSIACTRSHGPHQRAFLQNDMLLSIFLLAHRRPPRLRVRADGWNVVDLKKESSIMLSHVVRVTPEGGELLTKSCSRRTPVLPRASDLGA